MKFNANEATFLDLLRNVGGTYCPGAQSAPSKPTQKMIRRLERQGVVLVELTDDGPRYTLAETVHA